VQGELLALRLQLGTCPILRHSSPPRLRRSARHGRLADDLPVGAPVAVGGVKNLGKRSRPMRGSELDTVVGGTSNSDWSSWIRLLVPPLPYPGSQDSNKG
jgi:hypothetical protein